MTGSNVLVVMVDELQAAALSCAGHPLVKTPNIDSLAERGCRFTNAYTNSPICVPSRASFATGRYVHDIGYWDNAIAYDGRVASWGHLLQDKAIAPVSIGKLHYRNCEDDTGFTQQIRPLHIFDGIGQVWGSVRDPLPQQPHPARMIGGVGAGMSKYNRYDMAVGDDTADWLRAAPRADTPWMIFSSFVAPHFPLVVPQTYLDLYPLKEIEMPRLLPRAGYAQHPWLARMEQFQPNDAEFASDEERKLGIASYYALCTFIDAQVGKVLDALRETGQESNTLVLFTSDHGEMLGTRGRWGKSTLYAESVRIPMILAGPGVAPGTTNATPVSLVDAAPTITETMGADTPDDWPGQSLVALSAMTDPTRRVFSEYHAVASPSAAYMLADARWKYHEYVGYPPELFDLEADPEETTDLAPDPEHRAILRQMQDALRQVCDPESVDRAAKTAQNDLINSFGGAQAASRLGPMGASPVPS
ncbi:sulfatase-like hydrolase/transferase [Tritonibacter scottomollicae]|uniref:sulfatase-like hydrolase/transferase n=1 Tax=Tritonibacter scottomollicae TaxID=483013 RepID=UPI003BAC9339